MAPLGYREVLALVMEDLSRVPQGQYALLAERVVDAAASKSLIPAPRSPGHEVAEHRIHSLVHEALWDCLLKRIIVFGSNNANPAWPFYRVTERGDVTLKAGTPQPYDPDGFIAHFRRTVVSTDPIVDSYVVEAVQAFNAGCTRSAAVMLGCASEKLLLLLCDAFEAGIADPEKKAKFAKDLSTSWTISHRYAVLRDRLDRMTKAKSLPREHAEAAAAELPGVFELLRRCRNAAGHPDVPGNVDEDTVFLNLRAFTEYARRVSLLTEHVVAQPSDW